MTLQERMRELRKERKETQRQVADAIGVTDRQYQRFETGVNLPGFENLVGIADHFGVSLDYLVEVFVYASSSSYCSNSFCPS